MAGTAFCHSPLFQLSTCARLTQFVICGVATVSRIVRTIGVICMGRYGILCDQRSMVRSMMALVVCEIRGAFSLYVIPERRVGRVLGMCFS